MSCLEVFFHWSKITSKFLAVIKHKGYKLYFIEYEVTWVVSIKYNMNKLKIKRKVKEK